MLRSPLLRSRWVFCLPHTPMYSVPLSGCQGRERGFEEVGSGTGGGGGGAPASAFGGGFRTGECFCFCVAVPPPPFLC